MPPTHKPLRLEAAILSRIRSDVTSRSNWAKESSTFRVSRPIEVVVLNCWVTETNETRGHQTGQLVWRNPPATGSTGRPCRPPPRQFSWPGYRPGAAEAPDGRLSHRNSRR